MILKASKHQIFLIGIIGNLHTRNLFSSPDAKEKQTMSSRIIADLNGTQYIPEKLLFRTNELSQISNCSNSINTFIYILWFWKDINYQTSNPKFQL